MPTNKVFAFRAREFKGSRLRCLVATHRSLSEVARFLNALAEPFARVSETDRWFPGGFLKPAEAKLGETVGLLDKTQQELLTGWWLAKSGKANTPNWDLASTCKVGKDDGLLLVEAKAHAGELMDDRCGATNKDNHQRIENRLAEVTQKWNLLEPGFSLTVNAHYQMCNRFAFAWKLAEMRIPVVLVYLGFLNAKEMTGKEQLRDHAHWQKCVIDRSKGVVPAVAWNRTFDIDRTPLTVLIRSADVRIETTVTY